jgi:hypothetical protein
MRFQLSSDRDWGWAAYLYRTVIDVPDLHPDRGSVMRRFIAEQDYSKVTADDTAVGCAARQHWAMKLDEILADTADKYTSEGWAMATGKRPFMPAFGVSMVLSYLKTMEKNTVDSL